VTDTYVRFKVLTAASMKFRFVFWDVPPCKIIVIVLMLEAARTSETLVDNYFTRQYIPEDKSELHDRYLVGQQVPDFMALEPGVCVNVNAGDGYKYNCV
jgi:hypothetical protein